MDGFLFHFCALQSIQIDADYQGWVSKTHEVSTYETA